MSLPVSSASALIPNQVMQELTQTAVVSSLGPRPVNCYGTGQDLLFDHKILVGIFSNFFTFEEFAMIERTCLRFRRVIRLHASDFYPEQYRDIKRLSLEVNAIVRSSTLVTEIRQIQLEMMQIEKSGKFLKKLTQLTPPSCLERAISYLFSPSPSATERQNQQNLHDLGVQLHSKRVNLKTSLTTRILLIQAKKFSQATYAMMTLFKGWRNYEKLPKYKGLDENLKDVVRDWAPFLLSSSPWGRHPNSERLFREDDSVYCMKAVKIDVMLNKIKQEDFYRKLGIKEGDRGPVGAPLKDGVYRGTLEGRICFLIKASSTSGHLEDQIGIYVEAVSNLWKNYSHQILMLSPKPRHLTYLSHNGELLINPELFLSLKQLIQTKTLEASRNNGVRLFISEVDETPQATIEAKEDHL